ncbi:MAG TPA: class I SAM-dependent methyltransferase [Ktedonobacteraceae bacterium]|jgi:ubiquinone/menaquinone biosynthesis C-methylase UbiE|nr:class I SAM-dependent methyltransferase [Ktedonobacteraceae bacterium]
MSSFGWDQMAEWWDEKLGDDGDLWHRALIDPPLIRLVGEVSGIRMLDLACGNGYLSRRFARQGASVIGVDANAPVIERARAREMQDPLGITYHVSDAARLEMLEDDSFDLVICNMALMDIENAAGAIQEVARVLQPRGRFVASLSHPCFDKVSTSGWDIERIYPNTTIWRKMSHYREIATDSVPWLKVPDGVVNTAAYHRPLSWYFRTLRTAGLVVSALEEPEPTEEFLEHSEQGPWIAEIPMHCVIETWKVKGVLSIEG